jgi:excisionase family DNA binding protein
MEKYLTVTEVAERLQVHWQSVLTYIKNGELEAVKLGRGYRISEQAIEEFVKKRTTKRKD